MSIQRHRRGTGKIKKEREERRSKQEEMSPKCQVCTSYRTNGAEAMCDVNASKQIVVKKIQKHLFFYNTNHTEFILTIQNFMIYNLLKTYDSGSAKLFNDW